MPRVRPSFRFVLSSCVLVPVLGLSYWKYDEAHNHRRTVGKCVVSQCPAGLRPVKKVEADFKPDAPPHCPNVREGGADEGEPSNYDTALAPCCMTKYVCAQTCGIDFQECFDTYWSCGERICKQFGQDYEDCLATVVHNDPRYVTKERVLAHFLPSPPDKEICDQLHNFQREACDCVPEKDLEETLKDRLADFYQTYSPDSLTKSGKVKDKKFWKAWRGKRPSMFFNLALKHADKTYNTFVFEDRPLPGEEKKKKKPAEKKRRKRRADKFDKMEL